MGRPVEISILTPYEYGKKQEKVISGRGEFIQWGQDLEEDENGFTGFTVAIVENSDGTVSKIDPEMIRFLDIQ